MCDLICLNTGASLGRNVRSQTFTYKGQTITFDMPGWCCVDCTEGIHSGEDLKASDLALNSLKAREKISRRPACGFPDNPELKPIWPSAITHRMAPRPENRPAAPPG